MKVSHRFSFPQRPQSNQKASAQRRRAQRPFRALWTSFGSRLIARGSVVMVSFDSELANTESAFRNSSPFILSETDVVCSLLRDETMPPVLSNGYAPTSDPATLPLRFAVDYDAVLDSFFSPPTRRVGFIEHVTVVAIRSHHSMTEEEKRLLYRHKSTGTGKKKSTKEREFEQSKHCFENAFEEHLFFPNHEGELVHPAHLRSFVRKVLPRLPRDTIVPGFSSFDEYLDVLERFAHQYGISLPEEAVAAQPVEV